jgi:deoxyribodipyrimidine photo-lyase
MKVAAYWFRRDLRLEDNTALYHALRSGYQVIPVFIFDSDILNELPENDARVNFIYQELKSINKQLMEFGSSVLIFRGRPIDIWKTISKKYQLTEFYFNKDYEPYAIKRDEEIIRFIESKNIGIKKFKDQVTFEENEILKDNGTPYTVFTPYKKKWLSHLEHSKTSILPQADYNNFLKTKYPFPSLQEIGFKAAEVKVRKYDLSNISDYAKYRDFPAAKVSSDLGPHLRFGTISIRQIIAQLNETDSVFLSELIWREFFMQILFHFPLVVKNNFRSKYDGIKWRNNEKEFELWCEGKTGYPFVDAGMRELNTTGYMHNRLRMIVAGFLCKHLLIDWRWGEAYFAQKLLDYELSSNNGNWQWAAGTGCDAAPYFRVFNPATQLQKFDKDLIYIKKWIPEFNTPDYPLPLVDHSFARKRALEVYKRAIEP